MKRIASLIFAALILAGLTASPAAAKNDMVPTKITSDNMIYSSGGSQVTFKGHVHVTRPDLEIWSEEMVVTLKQKPGGQQSSAALGGDPGEIEKIVALRKVRMLREGKEGFCDKATYMVDKDLLVMEEQPRLVDGKNTIQGKVIRLYLKDNRSEVEGSTEKQVEAFFFTPKQGDKAKAADKPADKSADKPADKAKDDTSKSGGAQ